MKIKFNKDYKGDKTNQCRCSACGKEGCGFNCEYQEWEKANPKLTHFQGHRGELIKKEYKLTSRLMTKGSEPDFLMDFKKHSVDFGRRVMLGRFPKVDLGLIDFSGSGGIYYNKDKADLIIKEMSAHGYVCTKNDYQEKTELQEYMDLVF